MISLALAFALIGPTSPAAPTLQVRVDSARHLVIVTVSPIDVAGGSGSGHHAMMEGNGGELPLLRFNWPVDGWTRGVSMRLTAKDGTQLNRRLVHHINVVNFSRRQLFYPIAERMIAMGQETEDIRLPASVGIPVTAGMSMGVVGMFHNESHDPVNGFSVELRIEYSPTNLVPKPLSVLPGYLDVQNPVAKAVDFNLPAGLTNWKYDFTMPITGRIIGAGGHLHDYGTGLQLLDVTDPTSTRTVLKIGAKSNKDGQLLSLDRLLPGVTGKGLRMEQGRNYRMTAQYQNPTGEEIDKGAMVHMILLFAPDKPEQWPALQTDNADYKTDLHWLETRVMPAGMKMEGMDH